MKLFDRNNIENYSKEELIEFGINFREQKKVLEDDIKLINLCILEMHELDWKERYGDYNVFEKTTTSYSLKKDYNYTNLMEVRPDLFVPDKAKMYKEYPDAIERKLTITVEMSKDRSTAK